MSSTQLKTGLIVQNLAEEKPTVTNELQKNPNVVEKGGPTVTDSEEPDLLLSKMQEASLPFDPNQKNLKPPFKLQSQGTSKFETPRKGKSSSQMQGGLDTVCH